MPISEEIGIFSFWTRCDPQALENSVQNPTEPLSIL